MVQQFPRDLVLAGDGPHLAQDVESALSPRFSVVPGGRARTVRRAWLDTFDWRLYRAGLTLEQVTGHGPGQLTLTDATGERITGPSGGVRWPAMADALAAGPLRDRVGKVSGIRALLPVARVVSRVYVLRARNTDDKTVARITLDQATVTQPAVASLPTRVCITAVRGYQAQADRIARLLAAAPGAAPAARPLLDAALAAAGHRPAEYTGKADFPLTAGLPAALAVGEVLLRLLDTLEANVTGTVRDIDTEFLHDLRVSVRRTRTALKLCGWVLPAGLAGAFGDEFKWLGDATTPTRDLDVYLLSYGDMAASLTSASPAELAPFHDYLVRNRAAERRRLVLALRSARFTSLTAKWRESLTALTPPREGPSAAQLASTVIGTADRRVIRRGSAITPQSPPENLHDLRKRCKELRYALEFFGSLSPPDIYREAVRELKGLQDVLGTFQDRQVQQREIREIAGEMGAARDVPVTALLAMGDLAAQLGRSERQARGEFAGRFARFAGAASQQRFRTLTAGAHS